MKNFILKSFVFIILMCLALDYFSSIFKTPHRYMNTINEFKKTLNDNKEIDVAIYGSSHAFCSFNPLYLDSITKTRSFNFGNDAQRIGITKYVIKETLKQIKPKVIVIDVYSTSIKSPETIRSFSFQKHSYDFFGLSLNKVKSSFEVFPVQDVAGTLFPVLRRNDFHLDTENMIFSEDYVFQTNPVLTEYRGFMGHPYVMKYSAKFNQSNFVDFNKVSPSQESSKRFSVEEITNLEQSIVSAKDIGAKVIITIAPFLPAIIEKKHIDFHKYIKEICKKNDADLIDFNLLADELRLSYKDFRDASHLNNVGAKKVSIFLGNYIMEKYNLPSREKEKDWILEQPITKDYFIKNFFSKESIKINRKLVDNISLESVSYYTDGINRSIIVKTNSDLTNPNLEPYKLGVYCFASDQDKVKLSDYSKKNGKAYDALNFNPVIKTIQGQKYIIIKTTSMLNKFSKVKFFLYDRDGFKGIIGTAIEVENIVLTQK